MIIINCFSCIRTRDDDKIIYFLTADKIYVIRITRRCAETAAAPPASGVQVNAAGLPRGFRTVSIELGTIVWILHVFDI